MGDSTAMTIEFLRARLLSERSLSRAAKERADQLAKRVWHLFYFLSFYFLLSRLLFQMNWGVVGNIGHGIGGAA